MTSSCGTSNVRIGRGFCSIMHGPAAGSLGRKKNQPQRRGKSERWFKVAVVFGTDEGLALGGLDCDCGSLHLGVLG